MKRALRKTLPALVAGTVLIGGRWTWAEPPTPAASQQSASPGEIQAQLQQLQAKVAQLEAQQKQADQATAQAVLKDADRRSTFTLSDSMPFSGNWQSGKFSLRSENGDFVLHPWLQFQARYSTDYRDGATGGGSETDNGFEIRRMKFGFDGNVFGQENTYLFNWATDRGTGGPVLEEAWVRHNLDDNWYVRGGQIKDPFAHESILSSKKFTAVERSYITDIFTGGDNFVQGIAGGWNSGDLQAEVAFTDGQNSPNQNFQDFPTNNWDWGVAGRVQYKLFGDWNAYDQFSSLNDKHDLLVIGGGVDLSQGGDTDQFLHTVDIQYNNTLGWGVFGAVYGRYTQNAPRSATPGIAEHDTYDYGGVIQVSYLIPDTKWEPFGRFDYTHFNHDTVGAGAEQDVPDFTVGTNYYWHNHDAKFTIDASYLPNGAPLADSGADILASTKDQLQLRIQFQLLL